MHFEMLTNHDPASCSRKRRLPALPGVPVTCKTKQNDIVIVVITDVKAIKPDNVSVYTAVMATADQRYDWLQLFVCVITSGNKYCKQYG